MTGLTAYELQELADDQELCAAIEPGADDSPWNCVATDIICTSSAPDLAAKGKDCPGIMSSTSSSSSKNHFMLTLGEFLVTNVEASAMACDLQQLCRLIRYKACKKASKWLAQQRLLHQAPVQQTAMGQLPHTPLRRQYKALQEPLKSTARITPALVEDVQQPLQSKKRIQPARVGKVQLPDAGAPSRVQQLISTAKVGDTYEVESIVAAHGEGKLWKGRVRWKGYNSGFDTWEPAKNLARAPEVLLDWERRRTLKGLSSYDSSKQPSFDAASFLPTEKDKPEAALEGLSKRKEKIRQQQKLK
eukprot:gene17017-23303_t